jgi:type IX secretion system PorP/SprF family membrane protein
MKRILTFTFLIISILGFSQSEPQFTMFWNNYSMFNPANTGLHYKQYGNIAYRAQWDQVENAPNSFTGLYETKLKSINSAIGVGYFKDIRGLFDNNRAYLNYAYHTKDNIFGGNISYGVSLVYSYLKFNPKYIVICDGCEVQLDPIFPITGMSQGKIHLNFGLNYQRDKLEVGLSSTQINQPYYNDLYFTASRHYFGLVSYQFKLSNQFDFKPSIYFKSDGVAWVAELNSLFTYKKQYWMGLTYRHRDALAFLAGVDIKEKFRVGYSYDYVTGPLGNYTNGSHEFVLAVMIK